MEEVAAPPMIWRGGGADPQVPQELSRLAFVIERPQLHRALARACGLGLRGGVLAWREFLPGERVAATLGRSDKIARWRGRLVAIATPTHPERRDRGHESSQESLTIALTSRAFGGRSLARVGGADDLTASSRTGCYGAPLRSPFTTTRGQLPRASSRTINKTTEQMDHHPKTFRVVVHLFSGLLVASRALFCCHERHGSSILDEEARLRARVDL